MLQLNGAVPAVVAGNPRPAPRVMHGNHGALDMSQTLLPEPIVATVHWARRQPGLQQANRMLAAEVPVAFSYNRAAHAVMMATPEALDDFALGFSLSEGIVRHAGEVLGIETVVVADGIELRITIADALEDRLIARRRHLAGPMGCGLCGLESLAEAVRALPALPPGGAFEACWVPQATAALAAAQSLHHITRSLHAAGFWQPGAGLVALREDVGRHNALDKLCGALAGAGHDPSRGAVVLTSRVSVEMVQKAAMLGCPVLIAVSAPTALAVRVARDCGMTLVAAARGEAFEVFSGVERLRPDG